MFAKLRDWHQNLSWNVGYNHACRGQKHAPPWWADKQIYALAYLQGKGVEIPKL
jgi:hypothetical protein